jgi:alpha-L-fucosidase 2
VEYTREIFSSAPDQVIVIRLKASKPKSLTFTIGVDHELAYTRSVSDNKELVLKGKARIYSDARRKPKLLVYNDSLQCNGMRFEFRVKATSTDGKITFGDSLLRVSDATEAILYVSGATNFNGYDQCPDKDGKDESAEASRYLKAAHTQDYTCYFNRVVLELPDQSVPDLPTDQRLAA